MENEEERPTTRTSRSLVGVLALHGCLFDACAVALLQHRPFLAYPSSLASRVNAVVGGDGCARVAGLMRRWHLLDDDTLPFVAALSAHFPPDELFVLDIAHADKYVSLDALVRTGAQWHRLAGVNAQSRHAVI